MSRRMVGFGICLPAGHSRQWPKVTSKLIKNVPARHLSICHNMPLCAMHFTMQWLSPFKTLSFALSVCFRLEKYGAPFDSSYPKHSNSGSTGKKKIPTFVYIWRMKNKHSVRIKSLSLLLKNCLTKWCKEKWRANIIKYFLSPTALKHTAHFLGT